MPEKYTPPGWQPSGPFTMILNDVAVSRYFGKRPEMGKPIPGVGYKTVTVGLRNVFGKLKPDDKVQVMPMMTLHRLRNHDRGYGIWEVKAAVEHKAAAVRFLMLKCGG